MIGDKEKMEILEKRVNEFLQSCNGEGSPAYKLLNDIGGNSWEKPCKTLSDLENKLSKCKAAVSSSIKYIKPRIGKISNDYSGDALFVINKRMPEIIDCVEKFTEQLFELLLIREENEYFNLLKKYADGLPESLREPYQKELFLKEWFNVESPNEVDVKDIRKHIKRLPKRSSGEVADFVWGVDEYFPEYREKLRSDYEKLGYELIKAGKYEHAANVYLILGEVEISQAIEANVLEFLIYDIYGDEDLLEALHSDDYNLFKRAVLTYALEHENYKKELPELLEKAGKKVETDPFLQRVLGKEELPEKYRKFRSCVWNRLGVELGKRNNYSGAVRCFKQALKFKDSPKYLLNLADALRDEGLYEEAMIAYKDLLARGKLRKRERPKADYIVKALYGLGVVTVRNGDLNGGKTLIKKALKLNPKYEPALKYLKSLRNVEKKYD